MRKFTTIAIAVIAFASCIACSKAKKDATDGVATIIGGKSFDVLVKDISSCGFAVLVDMNSQINIHKNDIMQLEFSDKAFEEDFSLQGRVVRMDKTDKYLLYGCRMMTSNAVVDRYIANKQLENRVNAKKHKEN